MLGVCNIRPLEKSEGVKRVFFAHFRGAQEGKKCPSKLLKEGTQM